MAQTINLDEDGNPIPNPTSRTNIDLAPVCFKGTFQNPCFWILFGVGATLAVQYILSRRK